MHDKSFTLERLAVHYDTNPKVEDGAVAVLEISLKSREKDVSSEFTDYIKSDSTLPEVIQSFENLVQRLKSVTYWPLD